MPRVRRTVSALLAALLALGAAGCGAAAEPGEPVVLRVLAGSELADMAETLREAEEALNVRVELTSIGSVEGAQLLTEPDVAQRYDAVWFGADQFFGLWPGSRAALLRQSPPLMRSPVLVGVRASLAEERGWTETAPPNWTDLVGAVAAGQFRFGMTRPDHSNSGLAGLVAVATALAGTGLPVTDADVPGLQDDLRAFFAGHRLTANTSLELSQAYLTQAGSGGTDCGRASGTDGVDGLIIYESEIKRMNNTELNEDCRLRAIYPGEGTTIAEYRLSLLRGTTPRVQEAFDRLWRWLLEPPVQERISDRTSRRPGNPAVASPQNAVPVAQLRYPTNPAVLRNLVERYRTSVRPPSRMVFVLDVSGSMEDNMSLLRNAIISLTGTDPEDPTTYYAFLPGEQVTFVPFNQKPLPARTFPLPAGTETAPTLAEIRDYVRNDLRAEGNTAMYAALEEAHRRVDPGPSTSIVLFSDGQNNCGHNYGDYIRFRDTLSPEEREVPIYTIAFDSGASGGVSCGGYRPDDGPAGVDGATQWERELRAIAAASGGQLFPASPDAPLYSVFWSIRGQQ
ncbi:VWA domain-containing protein [Catenuloplanes atrovinosus]|uniref:Ca-activated chloride channel family protein n=1 Tax=Catenuloplanes atrovinosus TaxID=137266 RepID=A0AAE4CB51_9ACTN|nr:VWA domain-containing protein [Catenuloplanes atrovinosus]MDR7275265.1 Ca-activated chloride channel family protein [Catenuloplanes atrovinosus]